MGAIRRSYEYLDEGNFKLLFKGLVRPHLEYAAPVWMPMYTKDVTTIENVQRWATKCTPSLKDMSYEEGLCKLGLPTLRFRRTWGDLIKVYKMFHIYDDEAEDLLDRTSESATRGHAYKLEMKHVWLQIRQHNLQESSHQPVGQSARGSGISTNSEHLQESAGQALGASPNEVQLGSRWTFKAIFLSLVIPPAWSRSPPFRVKLHKIYPRYKRCSPEQLVQSG